MKVVILAGGHGSRLAPETDSVPKPLIEVAGEPIIRHVMRIYQTQGFNDFVVIGGYRCGQLKQWAVQLNASSRGLLRVDVVDTGDHMASGSRLYHARNHLVEPTFMLTWCDGLANVDLRRALDFHRTHGRLATVTAVHPPERFGLLDLEGDKVSRFREKPTRSDRWVNGAFFVLQREVLDLLEPNGMNWETDILTPLASAGELMAWRHSGYWACMDTHADRVVLEAALKDGVFSMERAS